MLRVASDEKSVRRVRIQVLRRIPRDWFDLKPQLTKAFSAYELQTPRLVHRLRIPVILNAHSVRS